MPLLSFLSIEDPCSPAPTGRDLRQEKGGQVRNAPSKDADGLIRSVDGIIIDITGRIKMQEELVREEELKTISEISARLAYEIRNPLTSAGGFARRLLSSMNRDDPNREKVKTIVKEVG